jgi:hypothetical protein
VVDERVAADQTRVEFGGFKVKTILRTVDPAEQRAGSDQSRILNSLIGLIYAREKAACLYPLQDKFSARAFVGGVARITDDRGDSEIC